MITHEGFDVLTMLWRVLKMKVLQIYSCSERPNYHGHVQREISRKIFHFIEELSLHRKSLKSKTKVKGWAEPLVLLASPRTGFT